MHPRLKLVVKVFVVGGVLFQHKRPPSEKVRQAICSNSAINVDLILVLIENVIVCVCRVYITAF